MENPWKNIADDEVFFVGMAGQEPVSMASMERDECAQALGGTFQKEFYRDQQGNEHQYDAASGQSEEDWLKEQQQFGIQLTKAGDNERPSNYIYQHKMYDLGDGQQVYVREDEEEEFQKQAQKNGWAPKALTSRRWNGVEVTGDAEQLLNLQQNFSQDGYFDDATMVAFGASEEQILKGRQIQQELVQKVDEQVKSRGKMDFFESESNRSTMMHGRKNSSIADQVDTYWQTFTNALSLDLAFTPQEITEKYGNTDAVEKVKDMGWFDSARLFISRIAPGGEDIRDIGKSDEEFAKDLQKRRQNQLLAERIAGLRGQTFGAQVGSGTIDMAALAIDMTTSALAAAAITGTTGGLGTAALAAGLYGAGHAADEYGRQTSERVWFNPLTGRMEKAADGREGFEAAAYTAGSIASNYAIEKVGGKVVGGMLKFAAKPITKFTSKLISKEMSTVLGMAPGIVKNWSVGGPLKMKALKVGRAYHALTHNAWGKVVQSGIRGASPSGFFEEMNEELLQAALEGGLNLSGEADIVTGEIAKGSWSAAGEGMLEVLKSAPQFATTLLLYNVGAGPVSRGLNTAVNAYGTRATLANALKWSGEYTAEEVRAMTRDEIRDNFKRLYMTGDPAVREKITNEFLKKHDTAEGMLGELQNHEIADFEAKADKDGEYTVTDKTDGKTYVGNDAVRTWAANKLGDYASAFGEMVLRTEEQQAKISRAIMFISKTDIENVIRQLQETGATNAFETLGNSVELVDSMQQAMALRQLSEYSAYHNTPMQHLLRAQSDSIMRSVMADSRNPNAETMGEFYAYLNGISIDSISVGKGDIKPVFKAEDFKSAKVSGINSLYVEHDNIRITKQKRGSDVGDGARDYAHNDLWYVQLSAPGKKNFSKAFASEAEAISYANELAAKNRKSLERHQSMKFQAEQVYDKLFGNKDGGTRRMVVLANPWEDRDILSNISGTLQKNGVSESEIPGELANIPGITLDDGTMVIFTDNCPSLTMLTATIRHEGFHSGLKGLYDLSTEKGQKQFIAHARRIFTLSQKQFTLRDALGKPLTPEAFSKMSLRERANVLDETCAYLCEIMATKPGMSDKITTALAKMFGASVGWGNLSARQRESEARAIISAAFAKVHDPAKTLASGRARDEKGKNLFALPPPAIGGKAPEKKPAPKPEPKPEPKTNAVDEVWNLPFWEEDGLAPRNAKPAPEPAPKPESASSDESALRAWDARRVREKQEERDRIRSQQEDEAWQTHNAEKAVQESEARADSHAVTRYEEAVDKAQQTDRMYREKREAQRVEDEQARAALNKEADDIQAAEEEAYRELLKEEERQSPRTAASISEYVNASSTPAKPDGESKMSRRAARKLLKEKAAAEKERQLEKDRSAFAKRTRYDIQQEGEASDQLEQDALDYIDDVQASLGEESYYEEQARLQEEADAAWSEWLDYKEEAKEASEALGSYLSDPDAKAQEDTDWTARKAETTQEDPSKVRADAHFETQSAQRLEKDEQEEELYRNRRRELESEWARHDGEAPMSEDASKDAGRRRRDDLEREKSSRQKLRKVVEEEPKPVAEAVLWREIQEANDLHDELTGGIEGGNPLHPAHRKALDEVNGQIVFLTQLADALEAAQPSENAQQKKAAIEALREKAGAPEASAIVPPVQQEEAVIEEDVVEDEEESVSNYTWTKVENGFVASIDMDTAPDIPKGGSAEDVSNSYNADRDSIISELDENDETWKGDADEAPLVFIALQAKDSPKKYRLCGSYDVEMTDSSGLLYALEEWNDAHDGDELFIDYKDNLTESMENKLEEGLAEEEWVRLDVDRKAMKALQAFAASRNQAIVFVNIGGHAEVFTPVDKSQPKQEEPVVAQEAPVPQETKVEPVVETTVDAPVAETPQQEEQSSPEPALEQTIQEVVTEAEELVIDLAEMRNEIRKAHKAIKNRWDAAVDAGETAKTKVPTRIGKLSTSDTFNIVFDAYVKDVYGEDFLNRSERKAILSRAGNIGDVREAIDWLVGSWNKSGDQNYSGAFAGMESMAHKKQNAEAIAEALLQSVDQLEGLVTIKDKQGLANKMGASDKSRKAKNGTIAKQFGIQLPGLTVEETAKLLDRIDIATTGDIKKSDAGLGVTIKQTEALLDKLLEGIKEKSPGWDIVEKRKVNDNYVLREDFAKMLVALNHKSVREYLGSASTKSDATKLLREWMPRFPKGLLEVVPVKIVEDKNDAGEVIGTHEELEVPAGRYKLDGFFFGGEDKNTYSVAFELTEKERKEGGVEPLQIFVKGLERAGESGVGQILTKIRDGIESDIAQESEISKSLVKKKKDDVQEITAREYVRDTIAAIEKLRSIGFAGELGLLSGTMVLDEERMTKDNVPAKARSTKNAKEYSERGVRFDGEGFSNVNMKVARRKDLVGLHNITPEKLISAGRIGGFAMPSIAIVKDTMGHDKFGPITLVMRKDAFDPKKNPANIISSRDTYTPMFPTKEALMDLRRRKGSKLTLQDIVSLMKRGLQRGVSGALGASVAKDFNSLEDVIKFEKLLKAVTPGESKEAFRRFDALVDKIVERTGDIDITETGLAHHFEKAKGDVKAVAERLLKDEFVTTKKEAYAVARELKAISELPTRYFEGKLYRPVFFDEVAAAVVPFSYEMTHPEVMDTLDVYGVEAYYYDDKNEQSRLEAVNDAADTAGVKFKMTKAVRANVTNLLTKKRPDLTAEQRGDVINAIERLGEIFQNANAGRTPDDGKGPLAGYPKYEQAAAKWFVNTSVSIPKDGWRIAEALRIANKHKADPMTFSGPAEIFETFGEQPREEKIDPDTIPEFYSKEVSDNGKFVVYKVKNTREGQAAVRRIVDNQWGKQSQPWCLITRTDINGKFSIEYIGKDESPAELDYSEKGIEKAWNYWNLYNDHTKRIGFYEGKLVGFDASSNRVIEWWNREDQSERYPSVISASKLVKEPGVVSSRYIDEETGELFGEERNIHRGSKRNGLYEEWNEDGVKTHSAHYKDGVEHGWESYFVDGKPSRKYLYHNGYRTVTELFDHNGNPREGVVRNFSGQTTAYTVYKNGRATGDGYRVAYGYVYPKKVVVEEFTKITYNDGKKVRVQDFFNNEMDVTDFDEIGIPKHEVRIGTHGHIFSAKLFHKNGFEKARFEVIDGKVDGFLEVFNESGEQIATAFVEHGVLNGRYIEYENDGDWKVVADYRNGVLDGGYEEYSNGKKIADAYFRSGDLAYASVYDGKGHGSPAPKGWAPRKAVINPEDFDVPSVAVVFESPKKAAAAFFARIEKENRESPEGRSIEDTKFKISPAQLKMFGAETMANYNERIHNLRMQFPDFAQAAYDKIINYQGPLFRAYRKIAKGKQIADSENVEAAAKNVHGKIRVKSEEVHRKYIQPLLDTIKKHDLDVGKLDDYLYAKFAPERNLMIAQRTVVVNAETGELETMNEDGSGMSNAEAAALMSQLASDPKRKAYEEAMRLVWKMNAESARRMVQYGFVRESQRDIWAKQSPHYVPLKDLDTVRFILRRSTGRKTRAASPLAGSIWQAQTVIRSGEVAEVNKTLARFVQKYDPDGKQMGGRVLYHSGERKGVIKGEPVFVPYGSEAERDLRKAGIKLVETEDSKALGGAFVAQSSLYDKVGDRLVPNRLGVKVFTTKASAPNAATFFENGVRRFVVFDKENKEAMEIAGAINRAKLLTPNDSEAMRGAWNLAQRLLRWKADISTTLNPRFILRNMGADFFNTSMILMTEGKWKELGGFAKNYLRSMKAVRDFAKGKDVSDTEIGRYYLEARKNGMLTGVFGEGSFKEASHKLGRDISRLQGGPIRKTWEAFKDFMETIGSYPEQGARLSAYIAMRKSGMTPAQAAQYGREVSVDFNAKGELTPIINALYMFSNAGAQGIARAFTALKTGAEARGGGAQGYARAAIPAISTSIILGFISSMMMDAVGDDDDDEEGAIGSLNDRLPDYVKAQNINIPLGGDTYLQLPTRGSFQPFIHFGSLFYDFTQGKRDAGEVVAGFTESLRDSVDFIGGNSPTLGQWLTPTIFDPMVQILEGKDWTGNDLYRHDFGQKAPQSSLGKSGTSSLYKWMAEQLSRKTGGDDVEGGLIDMHPETYKLLTEFFVGSLGTMVGDVTATVGATMGGEFNVKNVPVVGGVARQAPGRESQYYAAYSEFDDVSKTYEAYMKASREARDDATRAKNREAAEAMRVEHPWLRSAKGLRKMGKSISDLRSRLANEKSPSGRKAIEKDIKGKERYFIKQITQSK